ncbi:MAG: Fis family transcriptional regulator [Gemmatimonadetes bacterium]|nr:Fis family transcriptional regulator [Gemmatimonadota bacterium]MBI3504513.1 Fis family transcriptional regulator [Pseudomonadota bacterium]
MFLPFSPEWAEAFKAVIAGDIHYRTAAKGWTWPIALVLAAAPALGYPDDLAVELELSRGECTSARLVPAGTVTAPFVLRADYATWKEIVLGQLDPLVAVSRRRVEFTGAMMTLLVHARAAQAMVACAQRIPTRFPDDELV